MLPTLGYGSKVAKAIGSTTTKSSAGTALPVLGEWDYKKAEKGPKGEDLPEGAAGWTPEGNPYFGNKAILADSKWEEAAQAVGILGKIKEYGYMFTKDIPKVDDSVWQGLKDKWKSLNENSQKIADEKKSAHNAEGFILDQGTAMEQNKQDNAQALEAVSLAGEAISTLWQAGSANGSLLSPVLRTVSVGVKAIGDLFNVPAVGIERALGATQGFGDAVDQLDSPLPKMESNWFTEALDYGPVGQIYDWARLALSPSENKWAVVKEGVKEGWESGRIFYSQVYDSTIKEDFLRRYRAGENPEFLAMELQNPLAEIAGQLILDPLNAVSMWEKGAKAIRSLDKASEAVKTTGLLADVDAVAALDKIAKTTDEAEAIKHWDTIVTAQAKAVEAVEGGNLLHNSFKAQDFTQGSRVKQVTAMASDFMGLVTNVLGKEGRGPSDVADAIRAGVLSVSKNKDEMQAGLTALGHLPSSHLFMNDQAITSFTVIRNLLTNDFGVEDFSKLEKLTSLKNPEEFATAAAELIAVAAKSQFPEVQEMKQAAKLAREAAKTGGVVSERTKEMAKVYDGLSPAVKALDEVNAILSKPKNYVNSWLSMDYFGARMGTAVKNVATNFEFIMADIGAKAWITDVVKEDGSIQKAYWSLGQAKQYVDDVLGFKPSAAGGFESMAERGLAAADSIQSKIAAVLPGSKIMEKGEAAAGMRVVASSIRNSLDTLLQPGKALPALDVLQKAGLTEKQAKQYTKFMQTFAGDSDKAMAAFRGMYGSGAADEWRHLDFLSKTHESALKEVGFYDAIEDFARTGGNTKEEVSKFLQGLHEAIDARAAEAVKDAVAVSKDHPMLDWISHLDEQVKAGNIDAGKQEVFKAVMQASQSAKNAAYEILSKTQRGLYSKLNAMGKADEAEAIASKYDTIQKAFLTGGAETKARTEKALFTTQDYYKQWKELKNPSPSDLVTKWKQANLAGDPPLDLTKNSLISALWDQHRANMETEWNTYFDMFFGQSEELITDFSKYMDAGDVQSQFARAREAMSQAQAYRKSSWEAGRLRQPTRDITWLAAQYGLGGATAGSKTPASSILTTINKYVGSPAADDVRVVRNFEKAVEAPIASLPEPVAQRFKDEAKRLLAELGGGTGPGVSVAKQGQDGVTAAFGSTNVQWYRDLPPEMQKKGVLEKALNKIMNGKGDTGANVQRMKEIIIENMKYGDSASGTPPDLRILQEMDADSATMKKALDNFNEITGQELTMNEAIRKSGGAPYAAKYEKLEDVPYEVAKAALEKRRLEKGLPEVNLLGMPIPPPATETFSFGRAWSENSKGLHYMLDDVEKKILDRFGQKTGGAFDPKIEEALKGFNQASAPKIAESKAIAMRIATEQRNFTLLNYSDRKYADVAKAYIMPYHFFYSRHYENLMTRVAQNPHIVAAYAKYKNFLESEHKNMPDWYKQQVNINPFAEGAIAEGLLGIPASHPLYMNLEASLNPLYGLTGTDFNDPEKRTDWFGATVDDMGKFGPSLWSPIQMAMAAMYQSKGQQDAAAHWGSRFIPLTQEIKTVSSFLPFLKKPVELDPAVNLFGGGVDWSERSRVGTALMQITNEKIQAIQNDPNLNRAEKDQMIGEVQAQATDAAYNQTGDLWDEAYKNSIQDRAPTVAGGWAMGVGFKPRSETDVEQERMFGDLNKLYALSDSIGSDQYRIEYDKLLERYPGMESILLARKGGDKRDSAFAYNVLNRLPPGKTNEVLSAIGLNQEDIAKFYESKGFTNPDVSFTKTEKIRFMAAVVDLDAMLNIPPDATRQEWTAAKNAYTEAQNMIKANYGEDIWDVVNHYYDLKDDNPNQAAEFRQLHPEVSQALTLMQQQKVMNPLLSAYYGGIDVVEAYVNGQVRQQLTDKYGQEIYDLQTEYFNTKVGDPRAAKILLAKNPQLKKFWDEKKKLDEEANRQFTDLASKIPEATGPGIRPDFVPESGAQMDMFAAAQGDQPLTWDQLSQSMSPQLQDRLVRYWNDAEPLPKAANDELDYVASQMGLYNGDALLRRAGLSLMQGGQQSQKTQPPAFSPLGYK